MKYAFLSIGIGLGVFGGLSLGFSLLDGVTQRYDPKYDVTNVYSAMRECREAEGNFELVNGTCGGDQCHIYHCTIPEKRLFYETFKLSE